MPAQHKFGNQAEDDYEYEDPAKKPLDAFRVETLTNILHKGIKRINCKDCIVLFCSVFTRLQY